MTPRIPDYNGLMELLEGFGEAKPMSQILAYWRHNCKILE